MKSLKLESIFSINLDESVRTAADLMYGRKIMKLPVSDGENVVGIITARDIVSLLAVCTEDDVRDMYFHSVVKFFSNYSPYN